METLVELPLEHAYTVTPSTFDEMLDVYDDIKVLASCVPYQLGESELQEYLEERLGYITVMYLMETPVSVWEVYPIDGVSKTTAEVHGIIRQDLRQVLPKEVYSSLSYGIAIGVMEQAFEQMGMKKLIAKVSPENRPAVGWCRMMGFKNLRKMDHGREVWKLTKRVWDERQKG